MKFLHEAEMIKIKSFITVFEAWKQNLFEIFFKLYCGVN